MCASCGQGGYTRTRAKIAEQAKSYGIDIVVGTNPCALCTAGQGGGAIGPTAHEAGLQGRR